MFCPYGNIDNSVKSNKIIQIFLTNTKRKKQNLRALLILMLL